MRFAFFYMRKTDLQINLTTPLKKKEKKQSCTLTIKNMFVCFFNIFFYYCFVNRQGCYHYFLERNSAVYDLSFYVSLPDHQLTGSFSWLMRSHVTLCITWPCSEQCPFRWVGACKLVRGPPPLFNTDAASPQLTLISDQSSDRDDNLHMLSHKSGERPSWK